jgi:DNA-binding PadR family transcriptional regulator
MYAYEIRQEIIRSYQFKPPMVTAYVVLYDLQRAGLVTTEWKEQRDRPARKYYKITKKGEELLREAKNYFKELAAIFK